MENERGCQSFCINAASGALLAQFFAPCCSHTGDNWIVDTKAQSKAHGLEAKHVFQGTSDEYLVHGEKQHPRRPLPIFIDQHVRRVNLDRSSAYFYCLNFGTISVQPIEIKRHILIDENRILNGTDQRTVMWAVVIKTEGDRAICDPVRDFDILRETDNPGKIDKFG